MGGPPAIAARLAAAQAALGHSVRIISIDRPDRQAAIYNTLERIPGFSAVQVEHLKPLGRIDRWIGHRTKKVVTEAVAWADVVHLHCVWDTILRVAAWECRRIGRPYLVLLNGMLDPWSLKQKKWKKKLALLCSYRKMLNHAAGLHLGNIDEQRLIKPLRLTAPYAVVPNGVFLEEIEPLPPKEWFYASHPELEAQPFILFLGRLHYKKGLDYLADAFEIVAKYDGDVRLVVAGPDEGYRGKFEQKIQKMDLTNRVHLIGPIYGRDKLGALVDSVCFCLPSRQEGFSVAITEALGCGAPVVISEGCHFPEVAQAGAGEVVHLDSQELAQALIRVLSDQDLRRRMGQAGRRLVTSRYTWPKIAQQTIDVYGQALGRVLSAD